MTVNSKKIKIKTTHYTELADAQWAHVVAFLPTERKRKSDLRNILNAILKIVRTGTQWRNMDSKYGKWEIVYYYFRQWTKLGLITLIMDELVKLIRVFNGRAAMPTRGAIDSQSVKIAPLISADKGIDGNKKINGRKRHIIVDSLGYPIAIFVSAANAHDGQTGFELLWRIDEMDDNQIEKILGDAGYKGEFVTYAKYYKIEVEISQKPETTKGFVPQTGRWQVERSFAWLAFYRRLAKDYEKTIESSISFIQLAFITIILAKLQN